MSWRRLWILGLLFVPLAGCSSTGESEIANVGDEVPLGARMGASVVWTGSEVIVSGGVATASNKTFEEGAFLASGAAYDPASQEWRELAPIPADPMSWPAAVWTGEQMLVVGSSGAWSFDQQANQWTQLPDPPFGLPDLVRDNERAEFAWSGEVLYVWRPETNDMGFYDPDEGLWQTMPGPGFDAWPARLLADESRLVALGTSWPSGSIPESIEVTAAEWVDGRWEQRENVNFATEGNRNIADVDAAAMVDGLVVVWGDYSEDPGPTYLLDAQGVWETALPMPLYAGMGHPGSVQLDGAILALTEGTEVAIFDMDSHTWAVNEMTAFAGQSVWTGTELLIWTGSDLVSWVPPATG